MHSLRRSLILLTVATCFLTSFSAETHGQPMWLVRGQDHTLFLEILKPSFSNTSTTFATSLWFLSGWVVATDVVTIVTQVPFSHFAIDEDFGAGQSASGIGNIYLGVEFHGTDTPAFLELGAYLPTAADESVLGAFPEFVDRAEAFLPNSFPLIIVGNYVHKGQDGLVARARGGLSMWLPTESGLDSEAFLLYGGQIGYTSPRFDFLGGVTGRWLITGENLDFGEATFHQFAFAAAGTFGQFQPGVSVRIPVDEDLSDIVDLVFGVDLAVTLPR